MANIFRKNKDNEAPEDFVLFKDDENVQGGSAEFSTAEGEEVLENTSDIDVVKISESLAEKENSRTPKKRFSLNDKTKKMMPYIIGCSVLAILIISAGIFGIVKLSNPLRGYAQTAVAKENIMKTMEVEGTLSISNMYEITSLVAGKVIGCDFEVGDTVKKNDVLYKLDDTEAKLAVERAKNEVDKANDNQDAYDSTSARIISTEDGVIQSLSIKTGGAITPGTQIGTIKRESGETVPVIAYMQGRVTVVSVRVGQKVSMGQLIATVKLSNGSNDNTTYDKKNKEIDLQSAQRHLENYTIKAPVSGVVVEKNTKNGDNVAITDMSKPMMVIADTNTLTFTFTVDEYDVKDIKKDLSVIVTTESIPDTTFSGTVNYISAEGTLNDEGKTMFDVSVSISEPGELRAGMKIKAEVVLASVNGVPAVPEAALMESDGQNALVLVKSDASPNNDNDLTESLDNELAYPWIKVPKGCELLSVKYGVSNGDRVQIIDGLKLGDIVVYNPDLVSAELVPSTVEIDETDSMGSFDEDEDVSDAQMEEELKNEIDNVLKKTNEI